MEATGIYRLELCEHLQKYSSLIVNVVNPVQSKSFSRSLLLRTKNDKVDSMMFSTICMYKQAENCQKNTRKSKKIQNISKI